MAGKTKPKAADEAPEMPSVDPSSPVPAGMTRVVIWPDTRRDIPSGDWWFRILVDGVFYEHVDEVDGLWRYR